jgi:hypothetical protein
MTIISQNVSLLFAQAAPMFDPAELPPIPAPLWFVQFFKVLGFVLHMLCMNIWFAGVPLILLMLVIGQKHGKRFAVRMFSQLPIIMAFGINFGIVPLLFVQTVYYKPFYTATILMAWHWVMVMVLVMIAYYSLYIAAFSVKKENKVAQTFFAGLIASCCLLMVAYIMVNAMSLMGRPDTMHALWQQGQSVAGTDAAGATYGLGINSSDPTLWYRYGTMFGLAMTTVAFWTVFDAMVLIPKRKEKTPEELQADDAYRRWAGGFAVVVAWVGGIIAAASYYQYIGFVETNPTTAASFGGERNQVFPYLIHAAIFAPFLGAIALTGAKLFRMGRFTTAIFATLAQLVALATFAIARQWIQNLEVAQVAPITKFTENTQLEPIYTSPLVVFLVLFVLGALVIAWMIRQMAIAPKST